MRTATCTCKWRPCVGVPSECSVRPCPMKPRLDPLRIITLFEDFGGVAEKPKTHLIVNVHAHGDDVSEGRRGGVVGRYIVHVSSTLCGFIPRHVGVQKGWGQRALVRPCGARLHDTRDSAKSPTSNYDTPTTRTARIRSTEFQPSDEHGAVRQRRCCAVLMAEVLSDRRSGGSPVMQEP